MRSPRVPGGSSAHFAWKEHPQTTLLDDEVEQGQRRRLQPYCNDHDYLPFFFFALLLCLLLIVEFVKGPTVEGTDDDDPSSGTRGDVPGPPTFLTRLAASSSMPA